MLDLQLPVEQLDGADRDRSSEYRTRSRRASPACAPLARMPTSVHEALEQILSAHRALAVERVPLRAALGRVLAEDIRSPIEHPPWDNSSMDGYAVRADDVATHRLPRRFVCRVLETVRAGQRPTRSLEASTAIRVMTGAPVPDGADTVIRVEDTDGGVDDVEIRDTRDLRRNVRPRGEDLRG